MSSQTEIKKLLFTQLVLDTHPDVIHQVEVAVDDVKQQLGFKEDVYGNVMVAVTEAVNNAIYHGNKEDQAKKIYLDFEMINQYRLLVRITDEGDGFDPSNLEDPTAPENLINIGGRGVFLMEHLSDGLDFKDNGCTVEMSFNI